jgi:predicted amidohydrolase
MDGRLVSRHRKIHPFKLKVNGTVLTEGISEKPREIHVLSGRHTRMAVVICSDLNDDLLPSFLLNVGVNLLLVPSRTVSDGSFGAILGPLASTCQGVCVIANVRLDEDPSMLLVSVPRPITDGQVDFYRDPTKRSISRSVFDPNVELKGAVSWP